MVLGYWVAKLAPITVFQPIFLVSEMVFPSLVGFLIFREIKDLTTVEKIVFPLGLTGGLIIGFSF